MKHFTLVLCILFPVFVGAQPSLKSPEAFLGYPLGQRFTFHHRVMDYYRYVAETMPHVKLVRYGETYEHRPLVYAVITAPEHFARLETIRENNLRRTGLAEGAATADNIAIVWLSYNVHGNEANSMEAAMQTLYELAGGHNTKTDAWLKNTVVILDPCMNPDGRDRYAQFYTQFGNREANPSKDDFEHQEPWPGGRPNHYLFDLNRDWLWVTQRESRQRLKAYSDWMPHVHVDFHEQGIARPYYFAPAAEPYHDVVTAWQREFQTTVATNHRRYFDANGWLYFTREIFDLYYPSYGDTYPMYNGAVGMTYEQAGGGAAGLSVTTETGQPLTLLDRLTHHVTTGLSTVEAASAHATRLVNEFEKYFKAGIESTAGKYNSYIVRSTNDKSKMDELAAWLDLHAIRYGHPVGGRATKGFDFETAETRSYTLSSDDMVIPAAQPKARLVSVLFDPQPRLPDSLTYDITAWNVLYARGLTGYALTDRIGVAKPYERRQPETVSSPGKAYAYVFDYHALSDAALLSSLLTRGLKVRVAERPFSSGGKRFEAGTFLVTRGDNPDRGDLENLIGTLAVGGSRAQPLATGMVDQGHDLGSLFVRYLHKPSVALLFGEETSSLSAGEIWHFFEQELHYPVTKVAPATLSGLRLSDYDVLIIPDGSYRVFDDVLLDKIGSWVAGGGRLILVSGALKAFADKEGFNLKTFINAEEKAAAEKKAEEERRKDFLQRYADQERTALSRIHLGGIYKVKLDNSHPLAFGLKDPYYTLKTSENRYPFLTAGWNVGIINEQPALMAGFAGQYADKQTANSLVFGVEENGQGHVIYLVDNPLFRGFWQSGKMIFTNAVFMVGQ